MSRLATTFRPLAASSLLAILLASSDTGAADGGWARWQAHDASSAKAIDHSAWETFLSVYVVAGADGINRVRYAAVDQESYRNLGRYVMQMGSVRISRHNRNEQFAYWVNLYNALTVKLVLDHYPVDSIRDIDISPGWFSRGPWGKPLIEVEGQALSLDHIEHRILRPIWRDPRVHYAVNCASLGCPNLLAEPFEADRLDAMLETAAHTYVNHPRGARVEGGELHVSSIYRWYEQDFGGSEAGVIAQLRRHADVDLAARLRFIRSIDGYDYDWRLNEAVKSPPPG